MSDPTRSLVMELAAMTPGQRIAVYEQMTDADKAKALFTWELWRRPGQEPPPGSWRFWLLRSGRGYGKTRAGAEWVRQQVESGKRRIALVGATAADTRDVMVLGESGIIACCPPGNKPEYSPGYRRLMWPNGAMATMYSAEEPDRLRGPQHDAAWCDELAAWRRPEAFDMLMFGLRLGDNPQCVITTTPRPTTVIRKLIARAETVQTHGSTYENRPNLAPEFFGDIVASYEGTRLGRQEIHGELLEDIEGALWSRDVLERLRLSHGLIDESGRSIPLKRVVLAIDPAMTNNPGSDETGMIVAGIDDADPPHGYVLADVTGKFSPTGWAQRAVANYYTWECDRIVAEVNAGGDMVKNTVYQIDPNVSYRAVSARKGKYVRAEPVSALYEQDRIHHVGTFPVLEDQMCNFTVDIDRKQGSPDRVDALVWAFTDLLVKKRPNAVAESIQAW